GNSGTVCKRQVRRTDLRIERFRESGSTNVSCGNQVGWNTPSKQFDWWGFHMLGLLNSQNAQECRCNRRKGYPPLGCSDSVRHPYPEHAVRMMNTGLDGVEFIKQFKERSRTIIAS